MPELPDITVYVHALGTRIIGTRLTAIRLKSPFLLRTVAPPITEVARREVTEVRRLGKRIVLGLEERYHIVLHLMVAGRLQWRPVGAPVPNKVGLAAFDFEGGSLVLVEAGAKKRAALHLVHGDDALAAFDRGGLEVMSADLAAFTAALRRENHTLKRCLTDPRLFAGIGNSYSDEILHHAKLSPAKLSQGLGAKEIEALFASTRTVLGEWTERLLANAGDDFPAKVTAFRDGMAVHGRYNLPCPACATKVQRVRYADNETNYCPTCQTGGKLLADRSLSRLLKTDWPRTIEELEAFKARDP
ncbi:MAG: formamidopyrimidine-DNA glycosylase [Deltaproteobacteria bacterium]|nr:formamidopyrimidine-DNA glycosylase [Deltaproteobacteria bacterium]